MKYSISGIENQLNEFLTCIRYDIEHLQKSLSYLDELKGYVVKRDENALGLLLDTIRSENDSYKENEIKRQRIRRKLAETIGCNPQKVTLTVLEKILPAEKKVIISENKTKLKSLINRINVEYSGTVRLLYECSRFNNLVLKSIFSHGKTGGIYYNAKGAAKRQNESAFVNLSI